MAGFLATSTGRPKPFLAALARAKVTTFETDDRERAAELLRQRPETARRLLELVHACACERDSRKLSKAARLVLTFANPVTRRLLRDRLGFEEDADRSIGEATCALADRIGGLTGKDDRAAAFDLFRLWVWYAISARGLGLDEAIDAARRLVRGAKTASDTAGPAKEAVVELLFAPTAKLSNLPKLLALTGPALAEAQERAAELTQLQDQKSLLERRLGETEAARLTVVQERDELREALAAAEKRIRLLQADLDDEKAATRRLLHEERGRFAKLLDQEVRIWLEDAAAALGLSPPYVDVAVDRVARVQKIISDTVARLNEQHK
jgi:hypothetical protein